MNNNTPNIVFILSDDQGPWAMRCAGNNEIITPNLDRMAASGIRFENFFCTSPVCSPARASLLTGTIPSQHGVQDWIKQGNDGPDRIDYLSDKTPCTEILARAGYTCGLSGKWHLGASDMPRKDVSHWYVHQKGSGHYYNPPMYRGSQYVEEPGYVSDLITDDAIGFIRESQASGRPFYCGHHGIWGKGNGTTVLNMYDTSVKVPALASRPGWIPAGVTCDALMSGYDFMPTLLDYVGLAMPPRPEDAGRRAPGGDTATPFPGHSLAHLLRGERDRERESIVVYDEYGPVRMVRTKTMKYVHRYPYGPHELYDLDRDPDERTNRVDDPSLKQQRRELKACLDEWFVQHVDPRRDGVREPVTGNGQIGLCGVAAHGGTAFDPAPRQVTTDPDYDPGMKPDE